MVETPDPMPEFSPPERPRIPNVSSRRPGTVTCATSPNYEEAIYVNGQLITVRPVVMSTDIIEAVTKNIGPGAPVRIFHIFVKNLEWPPFTDGLIEKGGAE